MIMGCKRKSFSLFLVVILAVSIIIMAKPAFAETSASNPNWVEVFRFSGDYYGTESSDIFTVSHSEFRVQWYVQGAGMQIDHMSKFAFYVYCESKPAFFEIISNVTGEAASYYKSGTLEIKNNQYRNFFLQSNDTYAPPWTMVVEENINSPPIDITAPSILIISPENKTYHPENISLTFNVNETTSDMHYSLDNLANVTTVGNTTLTDLSDGSHSLVVYANDIAGNLGKSETVNFTITKESQLETFPITASIIVVVLLAVAVISALLYRRHRT
jgi:hypothetical protein